MPSQDIIVGNLVLIESNKTIPADMVLLATYEPIVYVDTSGILGETRLSEHAGVTEINRQINSGD